MKILILGGDGMLGHKLFGQLHRHHEVWVTLRKPNFAPLFLGHAIGDVDVRRFDDVAGAISRVRPDAVVNCVGIIKQGPEAEDPVVTIDVNALFPHRLHQFCRNAGVRVIHISTDCVFDGADGGYTEASVPNPHDLYGRSKLLGEIAGEGGLTLRTSLIGSELEGGRSLVEWFLGARGIIKGFRRAIFTGLITAEAARVIELVLTEHRDLTGLWHVAAYPISKFDLLTGLAKKLGRTDVTIVPNDTFHCDRSLCGSAFEQRTGYRVPSWEAMLDELAREIHARQVAGREPART